MILKLRDRGDIPRRYGVEAAGYNYDAAVQQRKREKARGDDKVLTTPPVPFTADGKPAAAGTQPKPPGAPVSRRSTPDTKTRPPRPRRCTSSSRRPAAR
jgi:hypothetical protein